MSKLDYSKWDNIELSDDEDIECHPNIDKASFVRWKQSDIHRKREERRHRIAMLKQEQSTNEELLTMIQSAIQALAGNGVDVEKFAASVFERAMMQRTKDVKEGPKSTQEIFAIVVGKLIEEAGVSSKDDFYAKMPDVFRAEIPKIHARQKEIQKLIAEEEAEQNKKLTSDNICKEGFSKTILSKEKPKKSAAGKQSTVEVLNPGYASNAASASSASTANAQTSPEDDVDLRDLSPDEEDMMLRFAKSASFEEAFRFVQNQPEIVSKEFADHLMARSFKHAIDGKLHDAKLCAKWSLAISYCLQMGKDGIGLFFKRMLTGGQAAVEIFETDLGATFSRVCERAKVLREKRKEPEHIDDSNSNLTPEQAEAFNSFPKYFQDALFANDIDQINTAFAEMGEQLAAEVMEKCQKTGLISVLSEEEAQNLQ